MFYGKHFASMYEGSMIGAGTHVFALMGYVIAHAQPDDQVGGQVRLNPTLLSAIFGDSEKRIQEAIDFLCAPDPKSTSPDQEGRRLVKLGQFDYQVVNYRKYIDIRTAEDKREANRARQAIYRARKKFGPSLRERQQEADDALRDKPAPALPGSGQTVVSYNQPAPAPA